MLEVRIRRKAFRAEATGERLVLQNVGFAAAAGDVVVLLGPSGIGKSTMLRIVLGLDGDFDGSVRLPAGRIGVMFQEPRLMPWLTVEENLRLVQPDVPAMPDPDALLNEVLLPSAGALMPSALSLGMARRVALARALANDPALLVLDEPFASLDAALTATLGRRIADRASREGTLVLLSTHDAGHALTMASRVLVIAGAPATLLADITVAERGDDRATARLHRELRGRFPFLSNADPGLVAGPAR